MLLHVLKMPQISFLTTVTPISYVLAAILPLVFALIVNLITNRTLNRIDMIEALKSRRIGPSLTGRRRGARTVRCVSQDSRSPFLPPSRSECFVFKHKYTDVAHLFDLRFYLEEGRVYPRVPN